MILVEEFHLKSPSPRDQPPLPETESGTTVKGAPSFYVIFVLLVKPYPCMSGWSYFLTDTDELHIHLKAR